ncbi:MAG: glycosyltransferase [Plectolyngbya sp. WJT66-NPBG17]|jgi:rhamnosyltransferase|nr:glycosyltransferase [Plectolyngbya sp. WJT66-NPBG17]MBW4524540.1 glycosyltransferase [Phormidium tanganyikae FI6-MK23]
MSERSLRVAAYITAFEDQQAVMRCVQLLDRQHYSIEQILIVDNSRTSLLDSSMRIIVEHHPENIGVAGGMKIAVAWAIEQKFDLLWLFDQDSTPDDPDLLKKLVDLYQAQESLNSPIGIVAPLPIDTYRNLPIHGSDWNGYDFEPPKIDDSLDFYECDALITSGSLLSIAAAKNNPLPLDSLFLDAVDWFYCLTLRQNHYRILVSKLAILKHELGKTHTVKCPFSQQEIVTHTASALRYYYSSRNHTFLSTRMAPRKLRKQAILHRLRMLKQNLRHIRYYETPPRKLKVYACLRGTIDGLIGRLGRTW